MPVGALEGAMGGDKSYFLGRGHRSKEKGNFEHERARRIAFPSDTYTFWDR